LLAQDKTSQEAIIAHCQAAAALAQSPDRNYLAEQRKLKKQLDKALEFALRNLGDTPEEIADMECRIKQLRQELGEVRAKLAAEDAAARCEIIVPSESDVKQELAQLRKTVMKAILPDNIEEGERIRALIDLVTGGSIVLSQCGERRRKSGWLAGRFTCRLIDIAASRIVSGRLPAADKAEEIVIEFRRPDRALVLAEKAKELSDQGLLNVEIAKKLGVRKSRVTKLLQIWHTSRGLEPPDGRKERKNRQRKTVAPPPFQTLVDSAMGLWNQSLAMGEIARRIGCCRDTVTKIVHFWHTSRGLPVPDGRARRREIRRSHP
jgi:hypothetical protein